MMCFNERHNSIFMMTVRTKRFLFVTCLYFLIYLLENNCTTAASDSTISPTIYQISINDSNVTENFKNLPKVGKCCPVNQIMTKDDSGKTICIDDNSMDYSFSPYFSDFNKTGVLTPGDERSIFVAIIGIPCRFKKYILMPEETSDDEHYLLLNGSIFGPHPLPLMLSPGKDYCMEVIPDLGLRTFVCFQKEDETILDATDSRLIFYACGLLISVPFLVLTIVAYSITPRLMDVHGKALCHYCGCLAVAFMTLAFTQLFSYHLGNEMCISTAFVIQFSFVACFFWLNVMCIETYLLARRYMTSGSSTALEPEKLFFYYSVWAWTPPATLIIISMIMDLSPTVPMTYIKPNFGSKSCWFESDAQALPYFYVPVGLLVLVNVVLFVMTAIAITRHQRDLDLRRLRQDRDANRDERRTLSRLKRLFLVCLSLFFLMGMTWAMEVISWWAGGPLAWSAFDLINALQGLIVFGIFVLRKPIRHLVWHEVQKRRGISSVEPEVASMDRCLLNVLNIDALQSTERML